MSTARNQANNSNQPAPNQKSVLSSLSISPAASLAANSSTVFGPKASLETKERANDLLSRLPFVANLISSFLETGEDVALSHLLNKEFGKKLLANNLFRQALTKQLLIELVTAFQQPNPRYLPQEAASLLQATLHWLEQNPVERRLALAVSGNLPEEQKREKGENEDLKPVLDAFSNDPHKQALTKTLLLELIRAHQYPKAQTLLKNFPRFLNSSEDRLDYLFALMVSGYQNEAEEFIKHHPELLMKKGRVVDHDGKIYQGLTPYQYTLCLKHTQMRLMIRKTLTNEQAALQAQEFEAGQNPDMEALRVKYVRCMERTHTAYQFYIAHYDHWTHRQSRDYWNRVIGRLLQGGEWPVHWMQEMFYLDSDRDSGRDFSKQTDFSSEKALKALPEAKHSNDKGFYPWNQGYVGAKLGLKSCLPSVNINVNELSQDQPWLIQQGDDYYIYGPQLTGNLETAVNWKLIKLDVSLLSEAMKELQFSNQESTLEYNPKLRRVYASLDRALGGRVTGSGFSFDVAQLNMQMWGVVGWVGEHGKAGEYGLEHSMAVNMVRRNLAGLDRLNVVRTEDLNKELAAVRPYLTQPERSPSPL